MMRDRLPLTPKVLIVWDRACCRCSHGIADIVHRGRIDGVDPSFTASQSLRLKPNRESTRAIGSDYNFGLSRPTV